MKFRKTGLSVLCFALLFLSRPAASETSALQILFLPQSPESLCLGGNPSAASPGDLTVNPALLLGRTRPAVSAGMTEWWQGISYQNISVAAPVSGRTAAGVSYFNESYGDIDAYSPLEAPMGSVDAGASLAALGLAYRIGAVSAGAGVMNINQRLSSTDSGSAKAVIFGAAFRLWKLNTGVSYFTPSGKISYCGGSAAQEIPGILRAGLNFKISRIRIFYSMTSPTIGAGSRQEAAQLDVTDSVKLRAGMDTASSVLGLSAGFSLVLEKLTLDYAYRSADFGSPVQSVGISFKFGYSNLKSRLYDEAKSLFRQGFYDRAQERINEILILDPEYTKAKILGARIAEIIAQLEGSSRKEEK